MASYEEDAGYISDTYLKEGDTVVITTTEWCVPHLYRARESHTVCFCRLGLQAVVKEQGARIKALEEAVYGAEGAKRKAPSLAEEKDVKGKGKEKAPVQHTTQKKRRLGND